MAAQNDSRLKCLLLPLQSSTLLLPNSVVAEIVPAQRHHNDGIARPDWYIGHIEWRGMSLPLVSLESLYNAEAHEYPAKTSFVVLHRMRDAAGAEDYYAVYIDGIPHFQFLDETSLETLDTAPDNPYIAQGVRIDGATALIPDLDVIESQIDTLQQIDTEA